MNKISDNSYQVYFCYSKSKNYDQCIELIRKLSLNHKVIYVNDMKFHVLSLNETQIDIMALLYKLISPILYQNLLSICRKSRSFFEKINNAHKKVRNKLLLEGYIDPQNFSKFIRNPVEKHPEYIKIKVLISEMKYEEAVKTYYNNLGPKPFGVLTPELIYLKRLGKLNLSGRDLLYYKPESSRNNIISENLEEYIKFIDNILNSYKKNNYTLPMDIILENAQSIEILKEELSMTIFVEDNKLCNYYTKDEINRLVIPRNMVPEGRIFDRYIDQIKDCNLTERKLEVKKGLWTNLSPEYYKKNIIDKNYILVNFICYIERSYKYYIRKQKFLTYKIENSRKVFKEMNFQDLNKISEIESIICSGKRIEYTGKTHIIEGIKFYEIHEFSENFMSKKIDYGNPVLEIINQILREAENLLRDKLHLPRIGEGWISEMKMFNLLKNYFPDAKHQARPVWLKPQHIDVYIPSLKIAFEYQGKQHYEPVDFFGGEDSFKNMFKLDKRKRKKCKINNVLLIEWKYTENIDYNVLIYKLRNYDIKLDCY